MTGGLIGTGKQGNLFGSAGLFTILQIRMESSVKGFVPVPLDSASCRKLLNGKSRTGGLMT
jgi:hypothetical protein